MQNSKPGLLNDIPPEDLGGAARLPLRPPALKIVFGSENSEPVTRHLLNALLNLSGPQQIQSLQILDPSLPKIHFLQKGAILDVKAKDGAGRHYNIEVQLRPGDAYINRSLYYLTRLYSGQLESGNAYSTLLKTVGISLLDFTLFPDRQALHSRFLFHEPDQNFTLTDILELHTIELPKFTLNAPDQLRTPFERWLYILRFANLDKDITQLPENLQREKGVLPAMESMHNAYARDEVRALLEAQKKWEHDQASYRLASRLEGLAEGKAEGKAEGLVEGVAKGRIEGKAEGLAQGKAEARQQLAENLRNMGFSPEQIAQATSLSPDSPKGTEP